STPSTSPSTDGSQTPAAEPPITPEPPFTGQTRSWPADEYAATQRAQGRDAHVVMDLTTDEFLVVTTAR
ncbi:hypothetical protein, partial [Streptomyces lavendulae]|uniref:hypothetical protein n=1 Tax=Streptomyces lavendulae TaxID=1914 RepID=UPI0033E01AF3